jgi:DNA-binding NarL/FixJ family response regulator
MSLTILLVDDDAFNRDGMRLYLEREGLSIVEAGDETTAWECAQAWPLDAAVIDIAIPHAPQMASRPGSNFGITLAQRLKQAHPALGIVFFSAYEDRGGDVLEMVRAGTRGLAYKLKGCHPSALLSAIHDVRAGRVIIDPEVHANRKGLADELIKRLTPDEQFWVDMAVNGFKQLTPREMEIAHRLAASHNTEGIAQALGVSLKTAENYIGHVYDKLGLTTMGREAPGLRKVVVMAKACMIHDLRAEAK